MNYLKAYSRLSQLSYSSIRTFANRYDAPIGSGTKNTATETSSTGIGIRSASPSYSPSYNSSITGASGRNPEHMTSTDTRSNSFNTSGQNPRTNTSDSQDFASSTKRFADSTADSLKNLADEAANTAKSFVDQATGNQSTRGSGDYMNRSGDSMNRSSSSLGVGPASAPSRIRDVSGRDQSYQYGNQRDNNSGYNNGNRSRSPIDDIVSSANSVAYSIGNMAQGAISSATSFGGNFVPKDQSNQDRGNTYESKPSYYDEHDRNRDMRMRDVDNYGRPYTSYQNIGDSLYNSNSTRNTQEPGQGIGQFTTSSTDSNMRDNSDSFNSMRGTNNNTNYSSQTNTNMGDSTFATAQALAGTAANLAGYAIKGMADNAAYFASMFAPSSNSSSMTSSSSGYPNTSSTSHTERSASFNTRNTNNYGNQSQSYNSSYDYNSSIGTGNKRVEHFVSTDPRSNAFASAGHVSGFGAPMAGNFGADDVSYAAKSFADSAVSNVQDAVNQAAGKARDFFDIGSTYMNMNKPTGNPATDMMNFASSAAQAMTDQAAYAVGSTINSFVNVASTVANSFAPQGGQSQQYDDRYSSRNNTYGQDQNYIRTDSSNDRRPQSFTSTDTRSNFFNPGQGSGNHPVSPFDNPIGSFMSSMAQGNPVSAMIQGAVNTMASGFMPGSQQQSSNFFRQDQYSSSQSNTSRDPITQTVDSAVRGAGNIAQGLAETAASIASGFIPGSQNMNQRNPSR